MHSPRRSHLRALAGAALLIGLVWVGQALAVDVTPPLPTPQLQQRYLELTHELRCVQCQDESLADSEVDLAGQMRLEVHDLLLKGMTNQQVKDYLVSRYGEFILFKPRFNWRTAWLWLAPGLLMLVGLVAGWRIIAGRRRLVDQDPEEPLDDTADEHWQS